MRLPVAREFLSGERDDSVRLAVVIDVQNGSSVPVTIDDPDADRLTDTDPASRPP